MTTLTQETLDKNQLRLRRLKSAIEKAHGECCEAGHLDERDLLAMAAGYAWMLESTLGQLTIGEITTKAGDK